MKLSIPQVDLVIDCEPDVFCSVIIENQSKLYEILCDIKQQIDGTDGKIVLSEDNKVLNVSKHMELLMQFIPFELNKKILVNKMIAYFRQVATDEQHYCETNEMLAMLESYLLKLSIELTGNLKFTKMGLDAILKAIGIEFEDDYESLAENLIDYFELVREYDKEKLFITVNLRSFVSYDEICKFVKDIIERGYQVVMIENAEYPILANEKRYIIDENLCVIC